MTPIENTKRGKILGARWANYPAEARVVLVTVGASEWEWCQPLIGAIRRAVEVIVETVPGRRRVLYVDNEDGRALLVVLKGIAPLPGMRFLPVFEVKEDLAAEWTYQASVPTS
jgi:hypothetical protein